eukprot:6640273-Pyramimonas_sp.AAC.1
MNGEDLKSDLQTRWKPSCSSLLVHCLSARVNSTSISRLAYNAESRRMNFSDLDRRLPPQYTRAPDLG